ncbi:hypothetical protein HK405_005614 [Cladochytrium tenue]|nr:hypothetical protein HK405_005614 [Cladochytrium tenue]
METPPAATSPGPTPARVAEARAVLLGALARSLAGLDPDRTVLLLSGGLDTAAIAGLAPLVGFRFRHAVTVAADAVVEPAVAHDDADTDAEARRRQRQQLDLPYAVAVAQACGIAHHEVVRVATPRAELFDGANLAATVGGLQSFDPMELRGGAAVTRAFTHMLFGSGAATADTMEAGGEPAPAARRATRPRFDAFVTGDAADELFAGYSFLHGLAADKLAEWTARTARNMTFSAGRLLRAAVATGLAMAESGEVDGTAATAAAEWEGVRVVQPFVDDAVRAFALTCARDEVIGLGPVSTVEFAAGGNSGGKNDELALLTTTTTTADTGFKHGKLILRLAAPEAGSSQWRAKVPLETGSGVTPIAAVFAKEWEGAAREGALETAKARVWEEDGVVIRDAEHLHYYTEFRRQFCTDTTSEGSGAGNSTSAAADVRPAVPGSVAWRGRAGRTRAWTCKRVRFGGDPCIRCGFELERPDQYFCVVCGAWPARESGPPS